MKKLCLSLGAIVLSGLVLASCSGVKINKPKSKGSAVDSISVTTSEGTYEFKKDDKFADVYSKLSSYQYFTIDNTSSGGNYEYAYKTKSSVAHIEKGRDIPRAMVVKLAQILDTTPAYLMGWEEQKESTPTENDRSAVINRINSLSDDQFEKLADRLEGYLDGLSEK